MRGLAIARSLAVCAARDDTFSPIRAAWADAKSRLSSQTLKISFRSQSGIAHVSGQFTFRRANHPRDEGHGALVGYRRVDRSPRWPRQNQDGGPRKYSRVIETTGGNDEHRDR